MNNPFRKYRSHLKLKKPEELEYWKRRFKNASHKRRQEIEGAWARYARVMDDNLWRGGRLPDATEPVDANELKPCIFSILPQVISEPPVIEVRAYAMRDIRMAAIWERVGEFIDRVYEEFDEMMWAVYSALLYGNGLVKIGYWDDALIDKPVWGSGLTEPFGTRRSAYAQSMELVEIFPDFRARRWKDIRYLIHQRPMHMDDLHANPAYEKAAVNKIKPSHTAEQLYEFKLPQDSDVENEYVLIQEIHDLPAGQVKIMETNCNKWLYHGSEPYGILPFENLMFFPRPKSVWGDSISQVVEKHTKRLSEYFTYLDREVSRAGLLKILYELGSIGEEDIRRLSDNNDAAIGVSNVSGRPADSVGRLDLGSTGKEYLQIQAMETIRSYIRGATGVTQQERGVHEGGVETALEAGMLKAASEVRNVMRQRMFSRFASRVFSKLLYIVSQQYSPERICQMAGLEPAFAHEIAAAGPFDATRFVVDYGMTALNSRNDRLQKLMVLQQLAGQFLNPATVVSMAVDALDLDFTDELMVYQSLAQGQLPAGAPQNAAAQVANSRVETGGQQPAAFETVVGGM